MSLKRNERFTIRLSADEKELILQKMYASGYKNLADYFLHCVCSNNTIVVDTMPILEVKTELNKIGTNINQIAKKANISGFLSKDTIKELMVYIKEMQDTVNSVFKACTKGSEIIGLCEDSTYQTKYAP